MHQYTNYLMIVSPTDFIKKEVSRYKRASVNVIGDFESMYSIAHITITCQLRCKPFLVRPAIERMEKRLATMAPIELNINGFAFFNHGQTGKTIYAVVERTEKVDNWFRLLRLQMNLKGKNFVPYITIAKNIPIEAFNLLWPNFENREFRATFAAKTLTVLHRDTFAERGGWRVYRELYFGNRLLAF